MADETAASNGAPTCPGCHFGCALDDYQCGRGRKFLAMWHNGEAIPERRGPGMPRHAGKQGPGGEASAARAAGNAQRPEKRGGEGGPEGQLPPDMRLVMLLNVTANALRDERDSNTADEVLDCIVRQDRSATIRIIAERVRKDPAELEAALQELQQRSLAQPHDDDGRTFFEPTEEGLAHCKAWQEKRREDDTRFVSGLSEDEKQQLADLLQKMLDPLMKRRFERG